MSRRDWMRRPSVWYSRDGLWRVERCGTVWRVFYDGEGDPPEPPRVRSHGEWVWAVEGSLRFVREQFGQLTRTKPAPR